MGWAGNIQGEEHRAFHMNNGTSSGGTIPPSPVFGTLQEAQDWIKNWIPEGQHGDWFTEWRYIMGWEMD